VIFSGIPLNRYKICVCSSKTVSKSIKKGPTKISLVGPAFVLRAGKEPAWKKIYIIGFMALI
jgi:hypothetical protein